MGKNYTKNHLMSFEKEFMLFSQLHFQKIDMSVGKNPPAVLFKYPKRIEEI